MGFLGVRHTSDEIQQMREKVRALDLMNVQKPQNMDLIYVLEVFAEVGKALLPLADASKNEIQALINSSHALLLPLSSYNLWQLIRNKKTLKPTVMTLLENFKTLVNTIEITEQNKATVGDLLKCYRLFLSVLETLPRKPKNLNKKLKPYNLCAELLEKKLELNTVAAEIHKENPQVAAFKQAIDPLGEKSKQLAQTAEQLRTVIAELERRIALLAHANANRKSLQTTPKKSNTKMNVLGFLFTFALLFIIGVLAAPLSPISLPPLIIGAGLASIFSIVTAMVCSLFYCCRPKKIESHDPQEMNPLITKEDEVLSARKLTQEQSLQEITQRLDDLNAQQNEQNITAQRAASRLKLLEDYRKSRSQADPAKSIIDIARESKRATSPSFS